MYKKNDKFFLIGGWHIKFFQYADSKIEFEFLKNLNEFSSTYNGSADICFRSQKSQPEELQIANACNALVYEKKSGVFTLNVYQQKNDRFLWVTWIKPRSLFLAYSIDSMWRNVSLLSDNTNTDGLATFDLLADIFSYSVLAHGGIVFHGVVMEYQGRGVIISAPSGTGKTTHSNIWCDLGLSTIINGDRALCRFINGSWTVFGMPWCGTSGISQNRQVPIQAIVVLEQYSENIVERLVPLEALKRLLPNVYAPAWEPALYNKMLDRLDEIIPAVPIFLLRCRPDIDAALTLKSALDSL